MVNQFITMLLGDLLLSLFNNIIRKLDNFTIRNTDHMVMVISLGQFKNRVTCFKIVASDQASCFKLGKYSIYRGQPNVIAGGKQELVYIFSAKVTSLIICRFENFQDFYTRESNL